MDENTGPEPEHTDGAPDGDAGGLPAGARTAEG